MLRKIFLIFCLLCAALLFGCSKSETNNSNSTAANGNKPGATKPGTTTSSTGEKIGVPECDDYIARYEACAGKVPEAGRAAYKSALEQTRATWKKLADNPQTRATLAAACKQAAAQQAAAWKTYGCTD